MRLRLELSVRFRLIRQLPDPNFGWFAFCWDRSDSAAHAKLLVQSQSINIEKIILEEETMGIRITGKWELGIALDYHSISSEYLGEDEYGHKQCNTIRTEIGELVYQVTA